MNKFSLALKPALEWAVILFFVLSVALLSLLRFGQVLTYVFPGGAFFISIFLVLRNPILYFGFTWWICFLHSFIRRIADYYSSYTEPSPVLLAPYLVILSTGLVTYRYIFAAARSGGWPFLLSFAGIVYGLLIGLIGGTPASALLGTLQWVTPVMFGFYIYINWKIYPQISQNTQIVFIWGVLLMGIYGVYQFVIAPSWDSYWIENIPASSFGIPEPLGIRVFSTLNGPFVFALFLLPGLLMLLNYTGPLLYPASSVGYLALLLSRVRTAWGGWMIAVIMLFTALKPKLQMRLVLIFSTMILCIIPLTLMEPFADVINDRVETLFSITDDASGNTRKETYSKLLGIALSKVFGYGIGNLPKFDAPLDSAILTLLFSLGLFGSLFYISGLVLLFFKVFSAPEDKDDHFLSTTRAYSITTLPMLMLGPALDGVPGIALWGFLSLTVAAQKYHMHKKFVAKRTRHALIASI